MDINQFDWETYVNNYSDLIYAKIDNIESAWYHWTHHGIHENRKVFIKNKCINATNLSLLDFDILQKVESNIIISLTTIPSRFIENDFYRVIENLYNQILKPKYIIINICNNYTRKLYKSINITIMLQRLKNSFPNLIINYSVDYGPLTKIFGLLSFNNRIKESDIVIFVNDDILYNLNMTIIYDLCFQLYHCECVFVKNKISELDDNIIFYDNYQDFINSSLSYAIKYKHVNSIFTFFNENIKIDENIWQYYDLFIFIFYRTKKLYSCGINQYLHIDEKLNISNIDSFNESINIEVQKIITEKFLFIYDIFSNMYNNKNTFDSKLTISKNIGTRYLLFNTNNVSYEPDENNFHKMHIDIKYLNKNHIILSLTQYENNINDHFFIILKINSFHVKIQLPNNKFSRKESFIIYFDTDIFRTEHINYDMNIVQSISTTNLPLNIFFSIVSILNYMPNLNYILFDNHDVINYIHNINPKLNNLLLKMRPGSYRCDLFRILYLYFNAGIYFDCKMILLTGIEDLLKENNFVDDCINGNIYNAMIIIKEKKLPILKDVILGIIDMIKTEQYGDSFLGISGPQLCGKYIAYNNKMILIEKPNYENYIIIKENGKQIVKTICLDYYCNSKAPSYATVWYSRQVFNENVNIDTLLDYRNLF